MDYRKLIQKHNFSTSKSNSGSLKRKLDGKNINENDEIYQCLTQHGFLFLGQLSSFPKKDEDIKKFAIEKEKIPSSHHILQALSHKRAFTDFIVQYLQLPLSSTLHKKVLMITKEKIIPNMTDPRLLMTFLTESYDQGTSSSLLALDSVFYLIAKHNLYVLPPVIHLVYSPDFLCTLYTLHV
jgi:U3 small nucleolar RNA-associated protein 19